MLIVWLARECETGQNFIEIFRVVDDQILALRLGGEESIDRLWIEPFLAQGFALHLVEPRVKLCFELVPFFAMGVLGSPGETVELIDIEMSKDDLERHIFDNAHAELRGGKR